MDNVTHTLFGATLGRAVFHRAGRGATAAIVLASNAPDADIVMTATGALNYLTWHRGPTHGPLGVIGLAVVAAALVWGWQRVYDVARRAEHASFPTLLLAAGTGLVAHVLMDFPTSYGTRLLSPFNWDWYAVDLMPIIDLYLLAVLTGGLILGARRPAVRRQAAFVVIAFTMLNYTMRAAAHQWALAAAPAVLAPLLPPPCDDAVPPALLSRWPVDGFADHRARGATRCLIELAAVPTFLSPFRWQIIARISDSYQTVGLNLLRDVGHPADALDAPWRTARHHPDQWTPAVLTAAETELGRVFLGFSRFPATSSMLNDDDSSTVHWVDLRFANTPGGRPGSPRGMFSALVVLAPDGRVRTMRLGG